MRRGFSLAEILLSLGLISVAILAVMAIGTLAMKSTRKSADVSAAQLVANSELQRTIYAAVSAGPSDFLWTRDNPTSAFITRTVRVGTVDYRVAVYATDVNDVTGAPLGSTAANRAKKVDVLVSWMSGAAGSRDYGLTQLRSSRIVNGP